MVIDKIRYRSISYNTQTDDGLQSLNSIIYCLSDNFLIRLHLNDFHSVLIKIKNKVINNKLITSTR